MSSLSRNPGSPLQTSGIRNPVTSIPTPCWNSWSLCRLWKTKFYPGFLMPIDIPTFLCYNLIMNNSNKIKYPYKKATTDTLKERRKQILDSMPPLDNVIRSSLIVRPVKCGKPNCRCANGDGHRSLYLSSYYRGHTFLDYVPQSYEEKLSKCISDYEDATALLVELSEINLELFRRRELDV